jgi:TRAP-type C4-dicarboxylate transport system permease small subunit
MRRGLDLIYGACGVLAGISVIGILASVAFQVIARYLNITFDATEISGFMLAAAIFLGLAFTFRSGAHIRMTSLIHRARGARKRQVELFCTALSAVAATYFAWHAVVMVIDSYEFGDKSPGLMAVPFWIPQTPMALGIVVLAVAFIDEFIAVLRGKEPDFKDVEQLELEEAFKEMGTTAPEARR